MVTKCFLTENFTIFSQEFVWSVHCTSPCVSYYYRIIIIIINNNLINNINLADGTLMLL